MKYMLISLSLTVLLGPGVGHIYLRKFKKAILLILATLVTAIHLAWTASQKISIIPDVNAENITYYLTEFTKNNPDTMIYYDIIFAALWAYALVDVYLESKKLMPKKSEDQGSEEKNTPQ